MKPMKLPKHIQGAIFDLDGTLLDSLHVWQDVDARFFAKRNIPMPPEYAHAVKAMELFEAANYTKTTFDLPETQEELVREWHDMIREEYTLRVAMKPHAKALLEALAAQNIKLALATSSSRELFLPALKRHGVADLFSSFTETSEAARGKNFPDVYLLAAERLGLKPENCAVFEDILAGIRSAKRGGFYTVAVADPHSKADEKALKAEADLFLGVLSDLL